MVGVPGRCHATTTLVVPRADWASTWVFAAHVGRSAALAFVVVVSSIYVRFVSNLERAQLIY